MHSKHDLSTMKILHFAVGLEISSIVAENWLLSKTKTTLQNVIFIYLQRTTIKPNTKERIVISDFPATLTER